jgi:hypothetical protein
VPPRIRHPLVHLVAAVAVLGAAGAAQASRLVLDPTLSTLQIGVRDPEPLAGWIETELFELSEPAPPGIDEIYEITDILLHGGGLTLTGPDESSFEFMGLRPLLRPLPALTLGDLSSFALTANFEILEVDGDRALFRYLQLTGVGPGSVEGTSVDGVLTSLWGNATVVLKIQWWVTRFTEPCPPEQICVGFPPSIWPDETLVERDLGTISFHAGTPIPEPHAALLFAAGFALAGWSARLRRFRDAQRLELPSLE